MNISPGHTSQEDRRFQMCVDMIMTNKAINQEQHPSPDSHPQWSHNILETGLMLRISQIVPGTREHADT